MTLRGAKVLMAAVIAARSISFIFSKCLLDAMGAFSILSLRFLAAFVILAVLFRSRIASLSRADFRSGIVIGACYTAVMALEMHGIRLYRDTGACAFIEHTAVVIVPLIEAFRRWRLPGGRVIAASLVALAGLGLLTLSCAEAELNLGFALLVAAALAYSAAIIVTSDFSKNGDPLAIGIVQIGSMCAFSTVFAFVFESPRLPASGVEWTMLLALAVVCTVFGYAFQPMAQKYLTSEEAGIISALNPLFACLVGIAFGSESADVFKLLGGLLVIAAIIIIVLRGGSKEKEFVEILGVKAEVARSFPQRARGLIGRAGLAAGEGMLILRCNAIHTWFMRFPIDAVFLDSEDRVVKTVRDIKPWRFMVFGGFRAVKVLETQSSR